MTHADPAPPGPAELEAVFRQKDRARGEPGFGPRLRQRFRHYNPDDHYEAWLRALVTPTTRWLDVGCGRELFPSNRPLAAELAARCARLVGVDPDPTLAENPFVHERIRAAIDTWRSDEPFDLVTLRMVAEHVTDPDRVVASLRHNTAPGGRVVVYTVHRYAPVPLLTRLVPFRLRHPIKRVLWRTEAKDTFPTAFRMNTRRTLRRLFGASGFAEEHFALLDDCRTTGRFRVLQYVELGLARALRAVGLRYPECCLLGIYRAPLA